MNYLYMSWPALPVFIVVYTGSSSVVTIYLYLYTIRVLHITWIYGGRWFVFWHEGYGHLYSRHSRCAVVQTPPAIFIELGFAHRVRVETYSLNENHYSFHIILYIGTFILIQTGYQSFGNSMHNTWNVWTYHGVEYYVVQFVLCMLYVCRTDFSKIVYGWI